jgi:hypothetical protein
MKIGNIVETISYVGEGAYYDRGLTSEPLTAKTFEDRAVIRHCCSCVDSLQANSRMTLVSYWLGYLDTWALAVNHIVSLRMSPPPIGW